MSEELRNEIKRLGGKPGGRSSEETLKKQLAELQSEKIAEAIAEDEGVKPMKKVRKFTISQDRKSITTELIDSDSNDTVIIIPAQMNAKMAKHILFWFGRNLVRYFSCPRK